VHILSLSEGVQLARGENVAAGEYFCEDLGGAELMVLAGGGQMRPLEENRPFDESKDWNGKRILFERAGGYGDLILLTPVVREIKRRWPDATITVACLNRYACILANLSFEVSHTAYPVSSELARSYDAWVFLENAIERNPRAKEVHMTDLFAEIAGVRGIQDKQPEFRLAAPEIGWCMQEYPREQNVRRLAAQVGSNARCRMYPIPLFAQVLTSMIKRGWEVFLLGQKGEIHTDDIPNLYNLTETSLSFRQSCAVLNSSDCFVGNDSSLLHVAGALNVPAVGLYGAFPHELRTAYCPETVGIQGRGECAPCFHHVHRGIHFPPQGPCRETGRCEVLARIKPDQITTRIELIARRMGLTVVENE
jgi:ADP-heptose:LPS heptosyltransferase